MRPTTVLVTAVAVGAVPAVVLAALAVLGLLGAWPALIGIGIIAAASLVIGVVVAHDLAALATSVVRASGGGAIWLLPVGRLKRVLERMTRAIAEHEQEVSRLRRGDETVVERLPDPLIILAADRSIHRSNAAARAAFGNEIQAVLRHPELRAAIDRAFAEGAAQSADVNLAAPVPREVQANVLVMEPALPDGGQVVLVLSDRTRERAVERMRADFAANASHELRTPLASLIGFIETLRGAAADDPAAQRRFLAIMAEQAERMSRLIDGLLSLSRIELVEHQPPSARVDLASLLPRIVAAFEPRVAERAMTLQVEIARELPPAIGDGDQLAQVVQNLLDNALKYGREGGTIRLEAQPVAPPSRWLSRRGIVVSVADDGPGIARAHLPRLTERFYRIEGSRAHGTGLGLAIVKHIVNRHRGQLAIESVEGAGTTVSFWLPEARVAAPEQSRRDAAVPM
jgi:two-component system, OmpR family, phosphate regulon sensor histidine kinase PhoR